MSITINDPGQTDFDLSATAPSTSAGSQRANAKAASSSTNTVDPNQDTTSISSTSAQLSADTPVREDRVSALRMQIESGTYTINAHAVATAMFQNLYRS